MTSKGLISSEGAHTDPYESRLNRGTAITETDRSSSVGDDMPSHHEVRETLQNLRMQIGELSTARKDMKKIIEKQEA